MIIEKEAVGKQDAAILQQRKYTKHLIDYVVHCQVEGITLRGADESDSSENLGNFKGAIELLKKCCPKFEEQL